jgi:hypothetical protein
MTTKIYTTDTVFTLRYLLEAANLDDDGEAYQAARLLLCRADDRRSVEAWSESGEWTTPGLWVHVDAGTVPGAMTGFDRDEYKKNLTGAGILFDAADGGLDFIGGMCRDESVETDQLCQMGLGTMTASDRFELTDKGRALVEALTR